jgi:glucose-6-phosphate isomerase
MSLTQSPAWKALEAHFSSVENKTLKEWFAEDGERAAKFSAEGAGLFLDYSKNRIDDKTLSLFGDLLKEVNFEAKRKAMFTGDAINHTEGRAVFHVGLRNPEETTVIDGDNVAELVSAEQAKIKAFCEKVHSGVHLGSSGKRIKNIVNIGIGGSDLGPKMVAKALSPYAQKDLPKAYYVSNVDGAHLDDTLKEIDIEESLFIVASKTFTTQETMANAQVAKQAVLDTYSGDQSAIAKHFIALSTNAEAVSEFGIDTDNMFQFWNWVGGRYSMWSAIGMSIALNLGYEIYAELLAGAKSMDDHFLNTPAEENLPVIAAVIGVWYNNFFGFESHAVLPYAEHLEFLPAYLQQLDMESNGKYVNSKSEKVDYQTGPIIWGEPGTNGQHAFYQLIHQGTKIIASDFVLVAKPHHKLQDHNRKLLSNCIAQTEALMNGKTLDEVKGEMAAKGESEAEIARIAPHKVFEGNRPTNTIAIKQLTPSTLGSLISFYEHKVFTQGAIWDVNSFDQYGVELGKVLAVKILKELEAGSKENLPHDSSTNQLLAFALDNT